MGLIRIQEREHQIYQPTLETIRMVECFIGEHSGEYKRKALWQHLPKKMMYQTFKNTIEYLLESNKIAIDRDGYIVWIWDPEIARKYLLRKDLAIE
ncbi:conserved hypothetical protein [Methanocella paludicola SANAE]|uniref:Uncharacterized protein n=1 Tax=Methanocella paludicola (strain DSM 17711 / JCM 13418 / NBRC 101707 / SANAE) TaxID=304371 RepID=D1YWT8_METPS|nr:hypothetical protein [Methanocella paludicola]BAI60910.1 conserved hypothetical protein [Methanocella paludicola SANAE]